MVLFFFMRENTNILCLFFLAYFKTGSCCNFEMLWIQDSKQCIVTINKNGKEEFGMELFSKEYVKIKDLNELIPKGNLTDSDK